MYKTIFVLIILINFSLHRRNQRNSEGCSVKRFSKPKRPSKNRWSKMLYCYSLWKELQAENTIMLRYAFLFAIKQPSRGVLIKRCSENMQQIYGRTPLPVISVKLQSNFMEITLRHECSPVNLLLIFRTPFPKSTSERLLLYFLRWNFSVIQSPACIEFDNFGIYFVILQRLFIEFIFRYLTSFVYLISGKDITQFCFVISTSGISQPESCHEL